MRSIVLFSFPRMCYNAQNILSTLLVLLVAIHGAFSYSFLDGSVPNFTTLIVCKEEESGLFLFPGVP